MFHCDKKLLIDRILFTKEQITISSTKGNTGQRSVINFQFLLPPNDKSKRTQGIFKSDGQRQNIFLHEKRQRASPDVIFQS